MCDESCLRKVLAQPLPSLSETDRALLQRQFHDWSGQIFWANGHAVFVANPHILNRLTVAFQQDVRTVKQVEQLLFDLVARGHVT